MSSEPSGKPGDVATMPQMPHISSEYKNRLSIVSDAARRAEALVLAEDYRGYDPYDALMSPIFRHPPLRARVVRRGAQQVLRRLPINLRPVLMIRRGRNPTTLGLGLQAWALRASAPGTDHTVYAVEASRLVKELADVASSGWSGACWGYDFDWETRDSSVPAYTPTIVATGFVTNALHAAYERLGMRNALDLCESACTFVTNDLHRTPGEGRSFCWSYSPLDRGRVLNATAKGSRLLVQVGAATGRQDLFDDARNSLQFVVDHQRVDGSWPYAIDDPRSWADNFHTAYVLDALAEFALRTGDNCFAEATDAGWRYYRERFFEDGWLPKYYDTSLYPIDCTAVAQSMITLCRFGDVETALRIGAWATETLQRPDGAFVYRVGRHWTNRIHYMRWSTAWMLVGFATVLAAVSRHEA